MLHSPSGIRLKGLGLRVQREGDLQLRDSALQLLLGAGRRLYSRRSKTQLFNLSLLLVELLPGISSPVALAATSCSWWGEKKEGIQGQKEKEARKEER